MASDVAAAGAADVWPGESMFTAVALLVGVVIVWLLADQAYLWVRARQQSGERAWHGRGPGTTFRSTGFEDTIPPHEPAELLHAARRPRPPADAGARRAAT